MTINGWAIFSESGERQTKLTVGREFPGGGRVHGRQDQAPYGTKRRHHKAPHRNRNLTPAESPVSDMACGTEVVAVDGGLWRCARTGRESRGPREHFSHSVDRFLVRSHVSALFEVHMVTRFTLDRLLSRLCEGTRLSGYRPAGGGPGEGRNRRGSCRGGAYPTWGMGISGKSSWWYGLRARGGPLRKCRSRVVSDMGGFVGDQLICATRLSNRMRTIARSLLGWQPESGLPDMNALDQFVRR